MISRANTKYIRISPYKLRPIVDVIRGKSVDEAFNWLKTCPLKKAKPVEKTLFSAYSNAKNKNSDISAMDMLVVKEIRVDQGPTVTYFKAGAMGRANIQNKRMSHLEIILDKKS